MSVNAQPADQNISAQTCNCALNFSVKLAASEDYNTFKRILDVGKHPALIGRDMMQRNANNGGALFYDFNGEHIAVSLINPHLGVLLALNVVPAHRSHGMGRSIIKFLMPNFVRAIESKVSFFEAMDYRRVGKLKKGQTLNTQVMARTALFSLAGKLQKVWNEN